MAHYGGAGRRLPANSSLFDEGLSALSVGGMSTREPLRPTRDAHPLLSPLRALLSALNIPLSPSSLAIVTPSLLLAILEAILETRITDVPDEWRGSWTREHRRGVVDVLIKAIDEVVVGLTRSFSREAERIRWRADEVDPGRVVRGEEEEVAKLVGGLLEIAEAMGIPSVGEQDYAITSPDHTPRQHPLTSTIPPSYASSSFSLTATPTPSTLFAPRPLRRPSQPPLAAFAPRRATSAFSTSTRSPSSSAASAHSSHSHSTSLTVPSRANPRSSNSTPKPPARPPSLVSELSSSGWLSPPYSPRRSTRSRRSASSVEGDGETPARSTLGLLKRLTEEQERAEEREKERKEAEERKRHWGSEESAAEERRRRKGKGKERPYEQEGGQERRRERPRSVERRSKKGKEVPSGTESCGTASEKHVPCCESCGAAFGHDVSPDDLQTHLRSTTSSSISSSSSSRSSSPPPPPRNPADSLESSPSLAARQNHRRKRNSLRRSSPLLVGDDAVPPPCSCARSTRRRTAKTSSPTRANSTTLRRRPSEVSLPSSSIPIAAPPSPPPPKPTRRIRIDRSFVVPDSTSSAAESAQRPLQPRPHPSAAAAVPPPARPPPSTAAKTGTRQLRRPADGDLSIHGESEIEAFERLHFGHSFPPISSQPAPPPRPQPATPNSALPPSSAAATTETPSPYTLMLLAQRDQLRGKLDALQMRERDRREAERSGEGWTLGSSGVERVRGVEV